MGRQRSKNFAYLLGIVIVAVATMPLVKAQTDTPAPTNSQVLITPSVSVAVTAIPTVTDTSTPTPTPNPDVMVVLASVGTQYPWNKQIPVTLSVTPTQSGNKLEIRWQRRAGLVASPNTATILNPRAGQTYTASFTLTPYAPGFQRAVADLILTTNATNFVSSKDIPIQLDANKIVVPVTTMYTVYQVGMYLVLFLIFFVAIPYAIYRAYLYIKVNVYPKWLESKIQSPV